MEEDYVRILSKAIERFSEILRDIMEKAHRILIMGHNDADGYSSMAIMALLVEKIFRKESIHWMSFDSPTELFRSLNNFNVKMYDGVIVVDFGSEDELRALFEILGERVFVIDHHVSYPEEYKEYVLNPRMLGVETDSFACSSTLSYSIAKSLGLSPKSMYAPSIVGAVGDVQYDYEDSETVVRALVGYNRLVLEELKSHGLVVEEIAPNVYGKYQQTVREAINKYGLCSKLFSDIVPERYSMKSWHDLKVDEKASIIMKIIERISRMDLVKKEILSELFIYDYIFPYEKFAHFHEAKEFSTLINNLVRLNLGKGARSLALSILKYKHLREDLSILRQVEQYLKEANKKKREYYKRAKEHATQLVINDVKVLTFMDTSETPMPPSITGSVTNFLMSVDRGLRDIYVVGTYERKRDILKISIRISSEDLIKGTIGEIIKEIAREMGGEGGGHKFAAGCEFTGLRDNKNAKKVFYDVIYKILSI
ncbi:MAG: DHH family phosphoesterase [Euryarchaeota archaeon]|nr:DHH family phosphoesterase [Euryarchaeota archaeon]